MSFVDGVITWIFATYTTLGKLCHTPSSPRNGRMANATSWTGWVFIAERVLKALIFRFEVFRSNYVGVLVMSLQSCQVRTNHDHDPSI